MIVVTDEDGDLRLQGGGQVIILEQDSVLERQRSILAGSAYDRARRRDADL